MGNKIQFGTKSCTDIKVDPFRPICSHPAVPGSAPLSIEVPAPVFTPEIPPNECICFDFEPTTTTVGISDCKDKPTCKVTIQKKDADCCTGRYEVVPEIQIPCIPFSIPEPNVSVTNKSGIESRGVDGSVQLTVKKDCCDIKTGVTVKLPDCVKYHPTLADNQIYYCDKGESKHHKLIELVDDPENCTTYPKVTPLQLPCCTLADATLGSGVVQSDGFGSCINWKLERKDCNVSLSLTPKIVAPTIPTPRLFDNGGSVDLVTSGAGSGKLYIDGTPDLSKEKIYGGGFGDLPDDDTPNNIFCRGPIMRGGEEIPIPPNAAVFTAPNAPERERYMVPFVNIGDPDSETAEGYPKLQTKDGEGHAVGLTEWKSERVQPDEHGEYTLTEGSGILNMVLPTGVQWHEFGMAFTLSEFEFTPNGVLSSEWEKPGAVIVAPAPAILWDENKTYHASGLRMQSANRGIITHGLAVDAGAGLRVNGTDERTPGYMATEWSYDDNTEAGKQGTLEVHYGAGLRTTKDNRETSPDTRYEDNPSTANGAFGINIGRGMMIHAGDGVRNHKLEVRPRAADFMHITYDASNKGTMSGEENGQLAIDDRERDFVWAQGPVEWKRRSTEGELILPICCGIGTPTDPDEVLMAYLHILTNGVILGVSTTATGAMYIERTSINNILDDEYIPPEE